MSTKKARPRRSLRKLGEVEERQLALLEVWLDVQTGKERKADEQEVKKLAESAGAFEILGLFEWLFEQANAEIMGEHERLYHALHQALPEKMKMKLVNFSSLEGIRCTRMEVLAFAVGALFGANPQRLMALALARKSEG